MDEHRFVGNCYVRALKAVPIADALRFIGARARSAGSPAIAYLGIHDPDGSAKAGIRSGVRDMMLEARVPTLKCRGARQSIAYICAKVMA